VTRAVFESQNGHASEPLTFVESQSPGAARAHTPEQFQGAIRRCDEMIHWYQQHLTAARWWYRFFSTATIVLTGLTPVLVLWQPAQPLNPIVQAAPAALAAVLATLLTSYRWREDWIRFAVAAETLRSEKSKFESRTTQDYSIDLADGLALDNFVFRIESLAISEVSEWRNQLVHKTNEPHNRDAPPDARLVGDG
jgi:hypothetical protein